MINIIDTLGKKCPYFQPSKESNKIYISTHFLSHYSQVYFSLLKDTNNFLNILSTDTNKIQLNSLVVIIKINYSKQSHFRKIMYKIREDFIKDPCVFGEVSFENCHIVVIRPYLGKIDEKFFRTYPEHKKNKSTYKKFIEEKQ